MQDLRSIDMNLLVDLDALLATRSVTDAARRVNLSQSAMSGSLARLRKLFGDPLLVRNGRTLTTTARAEALADPIREILKQVQGVLAGPETFSPSTSQRTFTISASDYATATLIAPMLRSLTVEAPNVTVNVRPRTDNVQKLLRDDRVDLAIEPRELMAETTLPNAVLFRDRWVCIMDASGRRKARKKLDLKTFLARPHVVYSIGPELLLNVADRQLELQRLARRIELRIESFLLVPLLVKGTDLVSLVLERSTRLYPLEGLALVEPPVRVPDITETMYWNPGRTDDPGHRWLRSKLLAAAADLEQGVGARRR
jgi:LysR family transcriptional regulator, nod-box dependent transcriptional activator